jgi:diadenosine tetraphosphate (Ap4A) HIT family hydrolase
MRSKTIHDPRSARTSADYWYEEAWKKAGKCVFCDLREKYIITEKNGIVLVANLYQYIDGHLLIIPRRHFEDLLETTDSEWKKILHLAKVGIERLRERMGIEELWFLDRAPGGFAAGKTVKHAHAHLIPYSQKLFQWKFQDIKMHPVELAKKLR